MAVQHQIKRQLNGRVEELGKLLAQRPKATRTAIAEELCQRFGFFDARGVAQRSTCLKALRELERAGRIQLPAVSRRPGWKGPAPRRLEAAVPAPEAVPGRVDQVVGLRLELVGTQAQRRVWNELVIREHPLGDRPLVGRQLRYLVCSEHGCLGAAGFASSARALRARDEWIDWDKDSRRRHLDRVVCLSRLLIRPGLDCANLASRVLGMLTERIGDDFAARYGYPPVLLESFVDTSRHEGTCYQAANWRCIGTSSGRGRQDRGHRHDEAIKDIYVYPLEEDFRRHLGVPDYERHAALEPGEGLDASQWADNELGGARLGDARLTGRLVSIARTKGRHPGKAFPDAVNGDRAATAGYHRFIDAPEESAIDMESILAPHRERTLGRIKAQRTVLCIHDTTDLNYATLSACRGLGTIGTNQTGSTSAGLRLHSSYVVSAEQGVPLGLWNWHCYAPEIRTGPKGRNGCYIPLEQKESARWVDNLVACMACHEDLEDTRVVHVMDREADFFELFDRWRATPGKDDLVIRSRHDRKLAGRAASPEENGEELVRTISEALASQEPQGSVEVDIPRKSARPKKGTNAARPKRARRRAELVLRWKKIEILSPKHGLNSMKEPVELWLLHAREETAPADGSKPIEWKLLTSIVLESVEDVIEVLGYYAKRWRIEDWHRILKTCCRVEEPAHRDSECLMRLAAINMVVAWRIHLMTLLGREVPELPLETLFGELEIEVLRRYCRSRRVPEPTNLGEGVLLVARLGGYLNRKHDGPPGAEILWRGSRKLSAWCECAAFSWPPG